VVKMLACDIYGLKTRIRFLREEDEGEVAQLLRFFLKKDIDRVDVDLGFKKKAVAREIGSLLFPCLAEIGIWAVHAGGFHKNGVILTVGPSECGKSTLTYEALKRGLYVLGDDIILLRENQEGIEALPFFSTISLRDETVTPEAECFRPGLVRAFLLPRLTRDGTCVKRLERGSDLMQNLVPQFLWSSRKEISHAQALFLERLCAYPAYELGWGPEIREEPRVFEGMLHEIVQG